MNRRKQHNPFKVPNLNPMYNALKKYIKKHQGAKGFILTEPESGDGHDTIYGFYYLEGQQEKAGESAVKAVRVNKYEAIEVMIDYGTVYDDETVRHNTENPGNGILGVWLDLKWDDYLYYIPTLFNLAENISEYTGEWECDHWWRNTDFDAMERITGYRRTDYPDADGYAAFVDGCDTWWHGHTLEKKKEIYRKYSKEEN